MLTQELPRRTHKGTGPRRITRADLERVVHLCQADAARALGIGVTRFKTACRQLGFKSWPYRKVKSVLNLRRVIAESVSEVRDAGQVIALISCKAGQTHASSPGNKGY